MIFVFFQLESSKNSKAKFVDSSVFSIKTDTITVEFVRLDLAKFKQNTTVILHAREFDILAQ